MAQTAISRAARAGCVALMLVHAPLAGAQQQQPPTSDPCQPYASCPNAWRGYPGVPSDPAAQSQQRVPSDPSETPRPNRGDRERQGGGEVLGVLAALVGIAVVAIVADSLTGDDWASNEELDSRGPRFPRQQAMGRFQVQGYGKAGWPIALDVETQPGTTTWLEARMKGQSRRQMWRVPIPEGVGRRVVVVRLPESDAYQRIGTIRYSVHSAVMERGRDPDYRPLAVYGIGAGPRAVGSMTLEVTDFAPLVARQPDDVRYAVLARRLYDRSAVEVLRLPRQGNKLELVQEERRFPLQAGILRGAWAAVPVRPSPPSGMYAMQVRAWLVGGQDDERDWTGAFAPNFIRIP